jgi:hypothetical protein
MDARQVAAQFAAYVWYENTQQHEPSEAAKVRFANANWQAFLPVAPEGLGRLLIRVAEGRKGAQRQRSRRRRPQLMAAG